MKKLNVILFSLLAMTFCSCNNKVNLYSDKGDSTVVYMMLDTDADTNYVKITKSFVGDATTLAHDYDACNYKYDEIKVCLLRMKNNNPVGDTMWLDTISKWIPYDPNSTFYSGCYQTYYYTTADLVSGVKYKLVIKRNDGVVVTSEAQTIDNFNITTPPAEPPYQMNFEIDAILQVKWMNAGANYETNAAYFEVVGVFRYEELMPGATEWVEREIKWPFGKGTAESLFNSKYKYYFVSYVPSTIFSLLESDTYLKNNSPAGVQRRIKRMRMDITGIGNELYNYLIINNSSSAIQDTPEYSNIENGIGLMSARVTHPRFVIPNKPSRQLICDRFPQYGFINTPNDPED